VFVFILCGCERVIDSGKFNSLKIGESKTEVIDGLIASGNVSSVKPDIQKKVLIDESSLGNIAELAGSAGIAVQGNKYSLQIHFESMIVSKLILSPSSKGKTFNIQEGMLQEDVLSIIKNIIKKNNSFTAFNFPAGSKWIMLDDMSQNNRAYLESFNTWSYHEDDKHSYTLLIFDKEGLNKIIYSWSPFELP
jgi:hypothetical protein